MSPEDISEHFSEFNQSKNLKFENYGESQRKMLSPVAMIS